MAVHKGSAFGEIHTVAGMSTDKGIGELPSDKDGNEAIVCMFPELEVFLGIAEAIPEPDIEGSVEGDESAAPEKASDLVGNAAVIYEDTDLVE